MTKLVLSLSEVAAALGTTPRSIQRWVADSQFPKPIRLGGASSRPVWRAADIELFVQSGSIASYRRAKANLKSEN